MTADHEFVLLACDGIWDVLTNQEVVEFVRARIAQRMEPDVVSWYVGTWIMAHIFHLWVCVTVSMLPVSSWSGLGSQEKIWLSQDGNKDSPLYS